MQESTKNPSFIPATHFYNDFKRIYNAKGNTGKQAKAIRHSIIPIRSAHIYTAYFLYIPIIPQQFIVNMQILYIFSWHFHIFIVILQPQTNKNTAYESKEQQIRSIKDAYL